MRFSVSLALALMLGLAATSDLQAFNVISPGDPIVAIDLNFSTGSNFPGAEGPQFILDSDPNTKYLNFGINDTGFIVTPATSGAVRSFILTTANDEAGRDPATWELYGTNDPITTLQNGNGQSENWVSLGMGSLMLPDTRFAQGAPVDLANLATYSSYKMIFPTVKTANTIMQIGDVNFYTGLGGTGTNILAPGDAILAIRDVIPTPSSNSPAGEAATFAIDRNVNTKYLNFGEENSGFIVTPTAGPTVVNAFQITTANDAEARDPASYQIYGTNDPIVTPNNGIGDEENWQLIQAGDLTLPADRFTASGEIAITGNTTPYASYRVVFPTVKDAGAANSMQIADFELLAADDGSVEVNRQTGEVVLKSTASASLTISNYAVRSAQGGLNDAAWNAISGTAADPNDTWVKTSAPGSTMELAEEDTDTGANDGLTIAAGGSRSLGNIWRAVPTVFEDFSFTAFGPDGLIRGAGVSYIGTEIPLGDYNGNGTVGPEDWASFRSGYGGTYTGMTAYEAYLGGDLNGDFVSDISDFNRFVELAGGMQALFGGAQVPEPSSMAICVAAAVGGLFAGRARLRRLGAAAAVVALLGVAVSAEAQTYTNVGGVPGTITIPAGQMNEEEEPGVFNAGPVNLFDDTFLDTPATTINGELFVLNYNGLEPPALQYAGMGAAPKVVFMDYGSTVTANSFAYAQRSGGDPTADRVGAFEFWFSNTPFGGVLPAEEPDAVVELLPTDRRLRDSVLRPYSLYGEQSGRYVAMRLTVSELSANQGTNNIGGHEFRLLDGPSDVVLEVDRATGAMTLKNNLVGAAAVEMKSYTIESPGNGLISAGFNGIRGDSGAFPAGNGSGNGWELGGGSNSARLAEGFFSGASTLAAGVSGLPLGNAYNPVANTEDLIFTWTSQRAVSGSDPFVDAVYNGRVVYIGEAPALVGDYNDDGAVDAADYTVWRDNLGTSFALPGRDPANMGVVSQADYTSWKNNFGNPATAAIGGSAVPEPATWVLALAMTAAAGVCARRRA